MWNFPLVEEKLTSKSDSLAKEGVDRNSMVYTAFIKIVCICIFSVLGLSFFFFFASYYFFRDTIFILFWLVSFVTMV